jgi:ABC-type dipeptide/oligopeptide/nickel transport system permease component
VYDWNVDQYFGLYHCFSICFAYQLSWFPVQGWSDSFSENLFKYALLPILIMLVVSIAPTLRLYRSFVLDEVNQTMCVLHVPKVLVNAAF